MYVGTRSPSNRRPGHILSRSTGTDEEKNARFVKQLAGEKPIVDFNMRLMQSLIYRHYRDHQVRQSALYLKYVAHPSMDDNLWDWQGGQPSTRAAFMRGVVTQSEFASHAPTPASTPIPGSPSPQQFRVIDAGKKASSKLLVMTSSEKSLKRAVKTPGTIGEDDPVRRSSDSGTAPNRPTSATITEVSNN